MSTMRQVKVKTMDNTINVMSVPQEITIEQLKLVIKVKYNKEPSEQRLLFKGKQMKDNELLSQYIKEDNEIIHLMFKSSTNNNQQQITVPLTNMVNTTTSSFLLEIENQSGQSSFIPLGNIIQRNNIGPILNQGNTSLSQNNNNEHSNGIQNNSTLNPITSNEIPLNTNLQTVLQQQINQVFNQRNIQSQNTSIPHNPLNAQTTLLYQNNNTTQSSRNNLQNGLIIDMNPTSNDANLRERTYENILGPVENDLTHLSTVINNHSNASLPQLPPLNTTRNFLTVLSQTLRTYSSNLQQSLMLFERLTDLLEREQFITALSDRQSGNNLIRQCSTAFSDVNKISHDLSHILSRTNFGTAPNNGFILLNGVIQSIPIMQTVQMANPSTISLTNSIQQNQPDTFQSIPQPSTNPEVSQAKKESPILKKLKEIMNSGEKTKTSELKEMIITQNENKGIDVFTKKFIAHLTIQEVFDMMEMNFISLVRQRKEFELFIQLHYSNISTDTETIIKDIVSLLASYFELYHNTEHTIIDTSLFSFDTICDELFQKLIPLIMNTTMLDFNWEKEFKNIILTFIHKIMVGLTSIYSTGQRGMMYCIENNIKYYLQKIIGKDFVEAFIDYSPKSITMFTKKFTDYAQSHYQYNQNKENTQKSNEVTLLKMEDIFQIATKDKKRIEEMGQLSTKRFSELYYNTNTFNNE